MKCKRYFGKREVASHPYPRGILEIDWPIIKYFKARNSPLAVGTDGFLGRGDTWKRLSTFLQKAMLSPQAAKGYAPGMGMVEAAEFASKGAPASASDLNSYVNRYSFDSFNSMMFGEMTKMADPNTGQRRILHFGCNAAVKGMEALIHQVSNPLHFVAYKLGLSTGLYNEMASAFDTAFAITEKKYEAFRERYLSNDLTEEERKSYLARAIERQATEDSNVKEEELADLIDVSLFAAVDIHDDIISGYFPSCGAVTSISRRVFDL